LRTTLPISWQAGKGRVLLTHEWSTVFEVLLVMGNTIAGQMVTGEIESMSSPEIVLNIQSTAVSPIDGSPHFDV
jgi:hypothetical protein